MHCRHHPTCPGCPLAGVPYADQLTAKRDRLVRALARYPHLHLPTPVAVTPARFDEGYRHRLKLPVAVAGDRVAVGLYHPRTHAVLDTPDCPVLVPALRDALAGVRSWLRGRTDVHAVDLRHSDATGGAQLVIAAEGGSLRGGKSALRALRDAVPALVSVAISTADPERKRVMGRSPQVALGEPWIEEAIGPTRYRLHPGAFFQADPRTAVDLHQRVREAVGDAETVLDLYAGVGAYALALAPGRRRVVAVEEVPQAARAARDLAPPNVEVVAARVEDLDLTEPFDVVVLNPARRGSDPHTLSRVAKLARRVVYVSCGPETLARDLDVLAAHGKRATSIAPLDLFPQTAEVETVVTLDDAPALTSWAVSGGRAGSPWVASTSGALGRASEALALVIGDPGPRGRLPGAAWERLGMVATHALIRLHLDDAPPEVPLQVMARRGHPVAGDDPRTARFFAEKAGLQRPFVHVSAAGKARAALHGDLAEALVALGASEADVRSLSPR